MAELGYNIEESERSFEKKGLTGEITKHMYEDLEYPYISIDMTKGIPPRVKLNLLQTLFITNVEVDGQNGTAELQAIKKINMYAICPKQDGGTFLKPLGKIRPSQVKSIIRMFGEGEQTYELVGYLNKDKEVKGEYLYIFAG